MRSQQHLEAMLSARHMLQATCQQPFPCPSSLPLPPIELCCIVLQHRTAVCAPICIP